MIVVCRNNLCPYYQNDFCARETVHIDQMGMCGAVWRKGVQYLEPPTQDGKYPKQEIKIMEAEGSEILGEDCAQDKIVKEKQVREEGRGEPAEEISETAPPQHEQEVEKTDDETEPRIQEGDKEID